MSKKVDLSNKVFGDLTVLKEASKTKHGKITWECICKCGKIKEFISGNLIQGKSTNCGSCYRIPDLICKRFGQLTVLSYIGLKKASDNKNKAMWLCEDDSGDFIEVSTANLTTGRVNKIYKLNDYQKAVVKTLYVKYKSSAKDRDLHFDLSLDDFTGYISQNCTYCGQEPMKLGKAKRKNQEEELYYNGIDRMDNDNGYINSNCTTCCRICNKAKSSMGYDAWIKYIDNLTNYRYNLNRE